MAAMTDPSNAMASFQQALDQGALDMKIGLVGPAVRLYFDREHGVPRFTYVKGNEPSSNSRPFSRIRRPMRALSNFAVLGNWSSASSLAFSSGTSRINDTSVIRRAFGARLTSKAAL